MSDNQMTSKLTSKSQTVVPRAIRRKLGLRPGDRIRYRMRGRQVMIEKVIMSDSNKDDPFIAFDEWASEADDKAYADL
jgi:antitoxin PrlF